ncbi:MAG: tRNA (adenine(22)-N(1))-methyltransferase TrmK [Clostridia bacterium]|nr:tRNA (adenine(22)-N(1))-methyltransferase TrmK [Clostridia bacterium]
MTNLRISAICNCVDKTVVAEIGADHGYITKQLFEQKKIEFAYLTDISKKCLQKAVDNFNNNTQCMFCIGNGLQALKQENIWINNSKKQDINPQQIIIAGMGGNEIIQILSQTEAKAYSNFVLQPQRNVVELRNFLIENNFEILSDTLVKEGKIFYFVIKTKKTDKKSSLTLDELMFGKTNLAQPNKYFLEYLNFEEEKLLNILKNKKVKEIEDKLEKIKQIKLKTHKGE